MVFLFAYLQYKLWISEGKIQDLWALEHRIETLQKDNQALQKRNKALQAEVENLKTGLDVSKKKPDKN